MAENIYLWSTTASSNDTADPAVPWPENMLPGAVNNSARSTMAAIARFIQDINGTLTTTGAGNTYAVTINSGITTYVNGLLVTAKANVTNTGASTLNVNSLGAKAIRVCGYAGEADVGANQLITGGTYQFRYDSAANSSAGAFMLLNPNVDPASSHQIGDIKIWTNAVVPTGWLWCDGSAVSRTTYSALFAVTSTTFGAGNGSTTFNLPDFRGRAPIGKDDMGLTGAAGRITNAGGGFDGAVLGNAAGAQGITLNTAQLPTFTPSGSISAITPSGSVSITDPGHTHSIVTHEVAGLAGGGGNTATDLASTGNNFVTSSSATGITASFSGNSSTPTFTGNSVGSGTLHSNVQPSIIVNYIIKV